MGPIAYDQMLPQLDVSPLLQGLQIGEQRRFRRAQTEAQTLALSQAQAEADQKAARQAAYQADVDAVLKSPTPEGYQRLLLQYPEQREAINAGLDSYSDGQKSRNLDAAMSVAGLLSAGNTDGALKVLKDRKTALNGVESTEITDSLIGMLESGDPAKIMQAKGLAGFVISAQLGDKAGPVLNRLGFGGGDDPKVIAPGSALVSESGEVLYQAPFAPGSGDFTLSEGQTRYRNGGSGTPRTQRLNNPGAIKDGSWAKSQPGYVGGDGMFAQFKTPAEGAAAHRRLLGQNYLSKGYNTPSAIVNRYAPVGPENTPEQVRNYANHIARKLGIGPNDKITTDMLPRLANAMAEFESGKVSSAGPQAVASNPKPSGGTNSEYEYRVFPDGSLKRRRRS